MLLTVPFYVFYTKKENQAPKGWKRYFAFSLLQRVKGECMERTVAHPVETVWSQSNVTTLTGPVWMDVIVDTKD